MGKREAPQYKVGRRAEPRACLLHMRIWVHIRRAATSKGLAECLESVFTRRRSHTGCSALYAATAKMLYRAVTGACGLATRTDQRAGGERFCTTDDGWGGGRDGAAESLPADLQVECVRTGP